MTFYKNPISISCFICSAAYLFSFKKATETNNAILRAITEYIFPINEENNYNKSAILILSLFQ